MRQKLDAAGFCFVIDFFNTKSAGRESNASVVPKYIPWTCLCHFWDDVDAVSCLPIRYCLRFWDLFNRKSKMWLGNVWIGHKPWGTWHIVFLFCGFVTSFGIKYLSAASKASTASLTWWNLTRCLILAQKTFLRLQERKGWSTLNQLDFNEALMFERHRARFSVLEVLVQVHHLLKSLDKLRHDELDSDHKLLLTTHCSTSPGATIIC